MRTKHQQEEAIFDFDLDDLLDDDPLDADVPEDEPLKGKSPLRPIVIRWQTSLSVLLSVLKMLKIILKCLTARGTLL